MLSFSRNGSLSIKSFSQKRDLVLWPRLNLSVAERFRLELFQTVYQVRILSNLGREEDGMVKL